METVSVTRSFDASPTAVEAAITDTGPFMKAMGVDGVVVDGDDIHVTNKVGPKNIELHLREKQVENAVFAYELVDGIFEAMTTTFVLDETPDGCTVTGTTEFSIDAPVAGWFLDATVITFQRRRELNLQFNYVEEQLREAAVDKGQ